MICACESIRREKEELLGTERISIGLWVGVDTSPNRMSEAVSAYNKLYNGTSDENPFVVLKCPWCGAQMGVISKKGNKRETPGYKKVRIGQSMRIIFQCRNQVNHCEFSRDGNELPLYIVDEDIYDKTPTLLLGTVDKFAMLPYRPEAQVIFGIRNGLRFAAPDLIIQDELHLISGPLGSMVGHYETMINELSSFKDGNKTIKPKIIASTATISRASEQCHALYGCGKDNVRQFPPSGLDAGDSFFAVEDRKASGRRYIGILANAASSIATTTIRLCGVSKSIAGALRPGALKRIGYSCKATKPWLGMKVDSDNPCVCDADKIKVLQRGASNVWFAETRSSIHIPTDDETASRKIIGVVNSSLKFVMNSRLNGELPLDTIRMLAGLNQVDEHDLYQAFERKIDNLEGLPEVTETMTEDEYRVAEYKVLVRSSGSDAIDFHSHNYTIAQYHIRLHKLFKSISLVEKLRETRAFVGFSRLEPNTSNDIAKSKEKLRLGNGDWLPAVEVYGEGIFFEFDPENLAGWAHRKEVQDRINVLNASYQNSVFSKHAPGNLRPEYILIHTFAHMIINQLSFECGYGSSSIRERINCERTTNTR